MRALQLVWICTILQYQALLMSILDVGLSLVQIKFNFRNVFVFYCKHRRKSSSREIRCNERDPNLKALSEIIPYSALLLKLSRKSLNKSLLRSLFNPQSHENSMN